MASDPNMIKGFDLDQKIDVYINGDCDGKEECAPGGWGVLIRQGNTKEEIGGTEPTTINRMRLRAIIEALKKIPVDTHIDIITDCSFIYKSLSSWIDNWKQNNWIKADGGEVVHQDLWKEVVSLLNFRPYRVKFIEAKEQTNNSQNGKHKIGIEEAGHIAHLNNMDPFELVSKLEKYDKIKKEGAREIKDFCQKYDRKGNGLSILMKLIPSLEEDLKKL